MSVEGYLPKLRHFSRYVLLQNSGEEFDRCHESSQYGSDLKTDLFIKQQTDGSCQILDGNQ